ncbi:hypothetical protein [Aeoliella sp. SH292]|uniref:hypothetical protein n=1 Tax=Aeoliella sp. SH292 TaxID=3454464 RepID=UPI003F9D4CC5
MDSSTKPQSMQSYRTTRKRVASLKPSPENELLYKRIAPDDPDIIELAKSISREGGVHDPLIVTRDNFILSGHRRHAALIRIGQVLAPCRVVNHRRSDMSRDEYIALLRDHNLQRHKSVTEQVREALVDVDRNQAANNLYAMRDRSVRGYDFEGVPTLRIEGSSRRFGISNQKAEHVSHVKRVIFEDRRNYWPLSLRGVHYAMLNYTFLRNTNRKLPYKNDPESYAATSDLLTRLRISGVIPWEAITDGTRPAETFAPFSDVRQFVQQEVNSLFGGYWRDLLQTQPNYVEVLVEKNTVFHMATQVTRRFQIPTSSGRGFNSIDSLHEVYARYLHSGKENLILVVLSDYDPEGEMIPHSAGRILRDDFGVEAPVIIKAGVTREQIAKYNLPSQNFAKETSSNHEWFVDRNDGGNSVYELEALSPDDMLRDLRDTITRVLDMSVFNAECAREREEAVYLQSARDHAREALKGLGE